MMNCTLKDSFTVTGVGLHSGIETQVKVCPAQEGEGRYFVRVDLPHTPVIPALVEYVDQTTLSTELVKGTGKVRTVEHLLAALVGMGIKDARIEINGSEVPLLDGSAQIWVEMITQTGITLSPPPPLTPSSLPSPLWIYEDDSFVAALPSLELRFTYGIDFPYPSIGNQWHSWSPSQEDFTKVIASARTFGFADQIEQLQKMGLIKGGSLENALVCDREKWLNPPLRFENEPVRHKLLDLIGDLSLLGTIPQAHFIAYKASHKLHVQLAKEIRHTTAKLVTTARSQ